jgi:hypothetical protein
VAGRITEAIGGPVDPRPKEPAIEIVKSQEIRVALVSASTRSAASGVHSAPSDFAGCTRAVLASGGLKAEWSARMDTRREALNLAEQFAGAGRTWVELDHDGNIVERGKGPGRETGAGAPDSCRSRSSTSSQDRTAPANPTTLRSLPPGAEPS